MTLRKQRRLTIADVARAMGKSASTIESYEQLSERDMSKAIGGAAMLRSAKHVIARIVTQHDHMLFGFYPICFARAVLKKDVACMARQYGYTKHTWIKFESGTRVVPAHVLLQLESDVRAVLTERIFK